MGKFRIAKFLAAVLPLAGIGNVFAEASLHCMFNAKECEDYADSSTIYQVPDSINTIPWENKEKYADLVEYYRQMIAIRRAHKGFRLGCAEAVKDHVEFLDADNDQVIVYRIKDLEGIDTAKSLLVILNGSADEVTVDIPAANYDVLVSNYGADVNGIVNGDFTQAFAAPYSATILAEK